MVKKLKNTWKGMTKFEKTAVIIRDVACFVAIISGVLEVLGILSRGSIMTAVMLPVVALAQASLSWKRSKAIALFFLGFVVFFFFVLYISKG